MPNTRAYQIAQIPFVATNAQTGTTYTTVLADQGKLVELSNASAITLTVPANSSLVIIGKTETQIYLEENDSLRLTAAANSTLEAVCSYEDLS